MGKMKTMAHSSPEDDGDQSFQGDDGDSKKQSNRACDFCHRMKMKCIGKETPPCNRCRSSGQQCTFDGPRKSKSSRVEDRLRFVETQMGGMQSAMEELLKLQRAQVPAMMPQFSGADGRTINPRNHQQFRETYPTPQALLSLESFLNPTKLSPQHVIPQTPSSASIPSDDPAYSSTAPPPPPQWPPASTSSAQRPVTPAIVQSAPASDDEDDEDPLNVSAIGPWDNMFSLAEAARLEQDGHLVQDTIQIDPALPSTNPQTNDETTHPFDFSTGDALISEPAKKKRRTSTTSSDKYPELTRFQRGDHVHHFPDCIELGYCSVEKARQMYDLFMQGCLVYMPCFDTEVDTFESLRKRSPFCLTALVMVGAKISDAGRPVSELQRKCREHAERIGMSTLFSPVALIEVVQAMIVLASWGDTSWRPGGHAIRMAMDMGLYRCLPLLAKGNMGKGKTAEKLKDEYPLVVGARIWLTLYKMEFEMAFNLGRPALTAGEETIRHGREFLEHPLSKQTDSRLVASCELLSARVWLHQPFALAPHKLAVKDLDEKLIKHEKQAEEWFQYWNKYYEDRGVGKEQFLRESLVTGRSGAELYTNSRVLHEVRNRHDVAKMSEERRQWLIKARDSAQTLVSMCLRSSQYTANFRFANLYTHLNMAFAARCLIRLVSLIPDGVNTRQIGRDVEKIAQALSQVPGFSYATFLRDVLKRARRHNILPPPSKPPSPAQKAIPLPSPSNIFDTTPPSLSSTLGGDSGSSFSFGVSPVDAQGFDFGYAEQLFSQPGRMVAPAQPFYNHGAVDPNGLVDQTYNLDAWFPFPPLETDTTNGQGLEGATGQVEFGDTTRQWW